MLSETETINNGLIYLTEEPLRHCGIRVGAATMEKWSAALEHQKSVFTGSGLRRGQSCASRGARLDLKRLAPHQALL